MDKEQKHVQIVNVEQANIAFAVETLRGSDGLTLTVTLMEHYPWKVGDPIEGIQVDVPFSAARALAVALLRPVYLEMPDTTKIATDDAQEYIAHLAELIYDISTSKHPDPIYNLLNIDKQHSRLLRKFGKERKQTLKWKRRWQHTAVWARSHQRKVTGQRKAIRALEAKIKRLRKVLQKIVDESIEITIEEIALDGLKAGSEK